MKRLLIYADASVIGGCEDVEFAEDSRALWRCFIEGRHDLVLSTLTLAELKGAPDVVRKLEFQAHREPRAHSPVQRRECRVRLCYVGHSHAEGGPRV
jgi:hypothetical protein